MKLLESIFLDTKQEKITEAVLKKNSNFKFKSEKEALDQDVLKTFRTKSDTVKIETKDVLQDKYSNKTYAIGYTIRNLTDTPIDDIYVNGKLITLKPNSTISLPTKWFTLFMSKIEYGYKLSNGEIMILETEKNIDDCFSDSIIKANVEERVVGTIDMINKDIEITDSSYKEYSKSQLVIDVDASNICKSAKLLSYMLAA